MNILVTGGAGYIGSVLTQQLLLAGHQVTVLDKCLYSTPESLAAISGATILREDVLDTDLTGIGDYDWCFHLAAVSNDPTAELSRNDTFRINNNGTGRVAHACATTGVPMLLASTASVYGFREWDLCDEDTPLNPVSVYAESKVAAEQTVARMHDAHGGFFPVLRQATVFGWSPRMRYDLVVNAVVAQALKGERVVVHGGGECWRPLVHVSDVVKCYIHIMDMSAGEAKGMPIYNIVHKNYRILELIMWINHVLGTNHDINMDVLIDRGNSPDGRSYALSGKKAAGIGLHCDTGIAQCIGEIVANHTPGNLGIGHPIHRNYDWLMMLKQANENSTWDRIP